MRGGYWVLAAAAMVATALATAAQPAVAKAYAGSPVTAVQPETRMPSMLPFWPSIDWGHRSGYARNIDKDAPVRR